MTDLRVGADGAVVGAIAETMRARTALANALQSRSCVRGLGLVSAALGVWAVVLMFGATTTEELMLWIAAAWVAWSAVIAIEVWCWGRACGFTLRGGLD